MKHNYLIAVLPPPTLSLQIDDIRKDCSVRFKVFKALRPPVHITLLFIKNLDDSFEKQLTVSLEAAKNFNPFTQQLENYDAFINNDVVYIKALLNKEIVSLYRNIKKIVAATKDHKSSFSPHITIAYRDIKDKFPEIHEHYKNESFKATFQVNHFTLLKHDRIKWNIIKEYHARPGDEQMELDL